MRLGRKEKEYLQEIAGGNVFDINMGRLVWAYELEDGTDRIDRRVIGSLGQKGLIYLGNQVRFSSSFSRPYLTDLGKEVLKELNS